jgi:hypothetical protein
MVNNFYVTTEALMKSSGDSLILNAKKKPLFTIAKRLLLSGGGTVKPPIRFNTKPLPGTKTLHQTTTTGHTFFDTPDLVVRTFFPRIEAQKLLDAF